MELRVEPRVPELPEAGPDWRERAHRDAEIVPPTNQARRERQSDETYPTYNGLTFGSQAEVEVYKLLLKLQREIVPPRAIAIIPLPSVRLRDSGVRAPDLIVIGNGRAVVVEVDGPHHYGRTRVADDADRDLHWRRCGVPTVRISAHHITEPEALEKRLREELYRELHR